MAAPRLSKAAKDEIVRRYEAGENVHAIAADCGVHFSYPGLLAKRRGKSLRASDRARGMMREVAIFNATAAHLRTG